MRKGSGAAVMNRRPRLELHGSTASPDEAAAVVAAIEQFLRDTAPPPAPPAEAPENPWIRAARLEAVDRDPGARAAVVSSADAHADRAASCRSSTGRRPRAAAERGSGRCAAGTCG